jgi:prepilin-type N-terminal cleavage/methylation domain-containing protein
MTPRGFTLVELIVVLAILVTLMGLVAGSFPRHDLRHQAVKAAANELAATCRQARAMAVGRATTTAVVFHIENSPGSSGRVLNNRSGGHWYRLLGPRGATQSQGLYHRLSSTATTVDNLPPMTGIVNSSKITGAPYTLFQHAEFNASAWQGPSHVLPAGRVRFLALSDMDYGDFGYNAAGRRRVASATPSFPRPWFGWYDSGNGRLHGWGGWDPAIPGSGFYYWGHTGAGSYAVIDPEPVGCRNPVDRRLDHWTEGQQAQGSSGSSSAQLPEIPASDARNIDLLYAAGTPRPLINAGWRDVSLVFTADGMVEWGGTLPARHCKLFWNNYPALVPAVNRGAAERSNGQASNSGVIDDHAQAEMGNFDVDAGGWFITLAPDMLQDVDSFPDANAALDSLMPMYRVFVSVLGEVRVVQVSQVAKFGSTSPWPAAAGDWAGQLATGFPRDRHLDASGKPVGSPISDFVTPDMLRNRSVWKK